MNRFFLVAVLLCSCGRPKTVMTEGELVAYVKDEGNELTKSASIEDYNVRVTYKPVDLLVSQELGENPVRPGQLDSLRKKYSNYYYFTVSLSRNNREALHNAGGGMGQYSALVQTLSFNMNEYVTMTTNAADTIPVADFVLNRTYGISSSTDLLFVFNNEKATNKEWVQFNLNEFGLGIGNQRFRFKRKDLDTTPSIDFTIIPNV